MSMLRRTRDLLAGETEYLVRATSAPVIHGVRRAGPGPPSVRDVRDALTLAYPEAVFTGWTAAALHGADFIDGHPPEIWVPQIRSRRGVIIRSGLMAPEDVVTVSRRRVTTGPLTAVDIARRTPSDEAIAGVDQCIREDRYGRSVTTQSQIRGYLDAHPGLYGRRRALAVLAESSTGADSPWETYTRLTVHRSGLRMFLPQRPIADTGYRVDLGSDEHRIAIEYDGGYHRSVLQQRKDVRRWNAISDNGWSIIRVTATTIVHDRAAFIARIEGELRRRGRSGPAPTVPHLELPPREIELVRSGFRDESPGTAR